MPYRIPRALPVTGQTATYATGDDGDIQAGWPNAGRFVDPGDGTLRDRVTALQWVKQPELIIPGPDQVVPGNQILRAEGVWSASHGVYLAGDLVQGDGDPDSKFYICKAAHSEPSEPPSYYWIETIWTASAANLTTPAQFAWSDALTGCNGLQYAGHDDWRVPNLLEMLSVLDLSPSVSYPWVVDAFPNIKLGNYWTSSTFRESSGDAWRFRTVDAPMLTVASKTSTMHVLPVRGGRING